MSSGDAPTGAKPALGGLKLVVLARAGFADEARTIASLSNAPRSEPTVAEALATADLLDGATADACRRNADLASGRAEPFWVKLRLVCYALAGQRDAADLTFSLLRDQGVLTGGEAALFSALVTGAPPKATPAPQTAIDLAALRQLRLPLAPGLLGSADAGVLKAIANDANFDPATRVAAAESALAAGAMKPGDLQVLFAGFKLDLTDLSSAAEKANARPDDPMSDVILYQAVQQMTAPEFLRDKAERIAEALTIADSFPRAYAAAVLYSEDIVSLEGAVLPAREAARFAVARMAVGDGDGAARWLFAMLGSGGLKALDQPLAMDVIALTNLLAVLDPISARAVAEAAGVSLDEQEGGNGAPPAPGGGDDGRAIARIVDAAFDAAIGDVPGQAGLAALAMSDETAPADPVAAAVISQSLRAAGFNELRRRVEFESAWRARFAAIAPAAPPAPPAAPGPEPAARAQKAEAASGGPTPRLKPKPKR
ncbi:MAG: hypothetical protein GC153_09335 [Alphaproteobacteria bacterium]|nr:hypothetical protein [Alphaproteobacteria bacterium]